MTSVERYKRAARGMQFAKQQAAEMKRKRILADAKKTKLRFAEVRLEFLKEAEDFAVIAKESLKEIVN